MLTHFLKKMLSLIPTIVGISVISFFLIRLIPGDPVLLMLGERGADPAVYMEMKRNLGLDLPIYQQYFNYLTQVFQGELGLSIVSKRPVVEEFFSRFPATLELGICAMVFAIILGIPLGVIAAVKRNSPLDYILMGGSLTGYSMPIFWWGLILILIFSVQMGITPVSGRIEVIYDIPNFTGFYLIDTLSPTVLNEEGIAPFFSAIRHLVLPSIAMGTIPLAIVARMTRSSMLEVLGQDFIRTAKAKGLSPVKVVINHALRNALIPIVTIIGLMFGSIITGAILTETIFSWPGIGKWLVASITARDYPVIQGGLLFIASMIVFINAMVDTLYLVINPRLRK